MTSVQQEISDLGLNGFELVVVDVSEQVGFLANGV
jgi:hypothetical protein